MIWQLYWPSWYKLYPWWSTSEPDVYSIQSVFFGFGPLQGRKYIWRAENQKDA